jgi:hypothetical protein
VRKAKEREIEGEREEWIQAGSESYKETESEKDRVTGRCLLRPLLFTLFITF